MLRLATNAARHSWKVIQFDALGSHARAATFMAAMQQAGLQDIRVFPHEPYNGWQATPELLQQHLLNEMPFYRGPYQQHLAALCLSTLFADRPMTGLKDLFQALADLPLEMMVRTSQHSKTPFAKYLREVSRQEFADLAGRFGAFATLLGDSMDGEWSLGHVDAAYLSFEAITHPLRAHTQATLLLADLVRYLVDAGSSKKRVLLLLQHPELLFDLEEQIVPFLSSIERLGASVILEVGTPEDLGSSAGHILSLAHTVVMHSSPAWWPYAQTIPGVRIPVQALTQLPRDECLVIQGGSVSRMRVDPVKVPTGTLQHASTTLYQQKAHLGWEQKTWSPLDGGHLSDCSDIDEVLAHFQKVWGSAWGTKSGLQGWTFEVKDSPFPTDLSKAFSTQSAPSKTGESKRTRHRGKGGARNKTHTHDSSTEQRETQQNPGDEDPLT
jgi:hypothetical protein